MAKKRSPEDVVVEFFSNAPVDRADMVLSIVRGILKRRTPPTPRAVAARKRKVNAGAGMMTDTVHTQVPNA